MDKDVLCTALQLVASSSSTAVGRAEKAKTNTVINLPVPTLSLLSFLKQREWEILKIIVHQRFHYYTFGTTLNCKYQIQWRILRYLLNFKSYDEIGRWPFPRAENTEKRVSNHQNSRTFKKKKKRGGGVFAILSHPFLSLFARASLCRPFPMGPCSHAV